MKFLSFLKDKPYINSSLEELYCEYYEDREYYFDNFLRKISNLRVLVRPGFYFFNVNYLYL